MGAKLFTAVSCVLTASATAAVTITPTPATVAFSYQIGAALPSPQNVAVRASSGTPAFTATVQPGSALWLIVSPETGKLPASLAVRVNPTGMAVGVYTAAINLAVTGVTDTVAINVTLSVSAPLPTLTLSATTLNYVSPPNPPPAQTVQLSTTGTPIEFTATVSGATWLAVSPAAKVVLPGGPIAMSVTVDPTALAPQTKPYSGKIAITATGAANRTQNITVSLTVNPATPTITSLWPNTVLVNSSAPTITIRGSNYYSASVAKAGSTPLTTTLVSPTVLQAVVPATMIAAAGTLNIIVTNPAPGGDSTPAVLTISSAALIQAIVNSASYAGGGISPGEIITLFGAGIGPATPVYMADADNNGYIDTNTGGLSVAIDGKASPILYADANQINVQVPYDVTQGVNKHVTVTNGSASPSTADVMIASSAPGIFVATTDGTGTGQAAALVYPAAGGPPYLNSASNPAHAGDVLVFYATGEGDYVSNPSSHTGWIVPLNFTPLPQITADVTIGGATATVNYAGPVPGSMIGLLQINAVVPSGLTTRAPVPLTLAIAGTNAQSNVTVVVK